MKSLLAPLAIAAALLAPAVDAAAAETVAVRPPQVLAAEIPPVAERSGLPVLLPERVRVHTPGRGIAARSNAAAGRYRLRLDARRGCDSCLVGLFEARRSDAVAAGPANTALADGTPAHYEEPHCFQTCTPPSLSWNTRGVLYEIHLRTEADPREALPRYASRAVAAGPR
jgi:hypothetical protein